MGNAIIDKIWFRWVIFTALVGSIVLVVAVSFPYADHFLNAYSIKYYHYHPAKPVEVEVDTTGMPPADAVPILMYHGVTLETDEENTSLQSFISQMEMLKREGYTTISVDEFYKFRNGEFILPPKPIIITFDDGRKDSYYTTDDILKTLGFKATMFYASGPMIDGDGFYLTWDELRNMQSTGRWEIEAHGRYSHKRIPTDKTGVLTESGRYLISKMYLMDKGRLETDEEFEARVAKDYKDNVTELKNELGITARYFAIPLNDYGQLHPDNHPGAAAVNLRLMKQYFDLAFIQANSPRNVTDIHLPVYNFPDENPYAVRRVEVKNMTADELKYVLDHYAPSTPAGTFPDGQGVETFLDRIHSVYGYMYIFPSEIVLGTEATSSAGRILVGSEDWQNYKVYASVDRGDAKEASLLLYYFDEDNLIVFDWNEDSVGLTERVDGVETSLIPRRQYITGNGSIPISATIKDGLLSVTFNGIPWVHDFPIDLPRGAPGFGVWDPAGGEVRVTSLQIQSVE